MGSCRKMVFFAAAAMTTMGSATAMPQPPQVLATPRADTSMVSPATIYRGHWVRPGCRVVKVCVHWARGVPGTFAGACDGWSERVSCAGRGGGDRLH